MATNIDPGISSSTSDGKILKKKIIQSLVSQGFRVENGRICPPGELSKERIRQLHETAIRHKIDRARNELSQKEADLLNFIASGYEVCPTKMQPRLVKVESGSNDELLFRYASMHWSIPVSSGYGRRMRFLVIDEYTNKLMGLIGLGDPVYNLGPRDDWVGWTANDRRRRLTHVMDAFVLGAVPPYSFLLCGKLVAMLSVCSTVIDMFRNKYGGSYSVIGGREHNGCLAMLTTTSALGRSSVYNRLRLGDRLLFRSVGYTKGSGEFHFSNGLYNEITKYAIEHCKPTAKKVMWGTGFRNRREVIKKCLPALGLSSDWLYHGIEREVFVIPLAQNTREYLRGEHMRLLEYTNSEQELFRYFVDRWMLPRVKWDQRYKSWSKHEWALWLEK